MSETSLSALVKEIGEALLLDDSNNDKAAYKKYVSCIYKIATNLILAMKLAVCEDYGSIPSPNDGRQSYQQIVKSVVQYHQQIILSIFQQMLKGGDVIVDSKTSRQVKLVQQCVDRVIALVDKMDSSSSRCIGAPVVMVTPDQSVALPKSIENSSKLDCYILPMASSTVHISPKISSGHTVGLIPSQPALVLEKNPHSYNTSRSHVLTPMEIARKQNQSLITAYKARMERLNRSDFNAFNYSLTIQRKMAENIAIAKAQEEELARKMQARNQRLEEEAAKRFATPIGMSKEEQEQRQMYKKILEYENEAKWLKNWRSRLEASPEDPILINQLVQEILRCSDHPFTELLHKYQFQIYQRLYPLVANKHDKIDLVKVPLPFSAWPSMDDVGEIFNDNIQSLNISEGVSFSRDNKDKTKMSEVRKEDSTDKIDKSLPVLKDEVTTDEPNVQDPNSYVCHTESELVSLNAHEVPCSQTDDGSIQSLGDSKRKSEFGVTHSENSGSEEESCVVHCESNSSVAVLQENRHESGDLLNENVSAASCDQQTETYPSKVKNNEHEPVGSGKKFDDPLFSDYNNIDDDLNNAVEEQRLHKLDEISYVGEDTPAQISNVGLVNVSQPDTHNSDNISESCDESSVQENVKPRTDAQLTSETDKGLESQLSWERRQAQLLMRQVTKDYNSYRIGDTDYDDNNLDYLFDDDDDDEGYGWLTDNSHQKTILPQGSASSSEMIPQSPGPNVDRSISHTPVTTRGCSQSDNVPKFQSLPTDLSPGIKNHQDKEFDKLSQDAYQRHLNSISDDIHRYLEKLLILMTIAYEPLDTPIGKDQCAVSLEEPFFKPIWKTLLRLFRVVNHKQELVLACIMTRYADATLEEFKVSRKLWLTDSEIKPYQSAINELINVKEHYTMLSKLDCIVKVCRLICECVDDHYSQKDGLESNVSKKAPSVGADDLLPILTYVIVQSATPQLSSECHAMTEFIHEGYMMGEEGYCLTSLRTALNYVISMFPSLTRSDISEPMT